MAKKSEKYLQISIIFTTLAADFIKCYLIKQYSSIKCDLIDMDKQILKQVLLDNAQLVEKLEVLPRAYALEG